MNRRVRIVLIVLFSAMLLLSGYMLADYLLQSRQQQAQFDRLAELAQQAQQGQTDTGEAGDTGDTQSQQPDYSALAALNGDMVGWICIEGTKINYPVMQTPEQPDYYLHRDFYGRYSTHGCIYVREQCDVNAPSDNLTVYGHRMRDGSMFRGLLDYRRESFYQEHKYIRFDTLSQQQTYEILAVFKTTADSDGFAYHLFVDAADREQFDSYIAQCKALALYDTGVTAQYGDKLITLSTCEWSQTNGRLVVVAKRIG